MLEQELISSAAERESETVEFPGWFSKLVDRFVKDSHNSEEKDALKQEEEGIVQQQLQAQLSEWLMIVKKYLEDQRSRFLA